MIDKLREELRQMITELEAAYGAEAAYPVTEHLLRAYETAEMLAVLEPRQ